MLESMNHGDLVMSYNMIDFTVYERLDCSAEGYYHKTFASYQKYKVSNIDITENSAKVKLELIHSEHESGNPKYAEGVVKKYLDLTVSKLYETDMKLSFFKALETGLSAYYILEYDQGNISLIAKQKGKVPSPLIPKIVVIDKQGINFDLLETGFGLDSSVYMPDRFKNVVHLPITSFGKNYQTPSVGDRLIFIDSVDLVRDRTFTREVVKVEPHAKCTCDVLTLDLPIDRLESNHRRIDGLGIDRSSAHVNNYTARFDKVQVFKRKENFKEILKNRGNINHTCTLPFIDNNYANMKEFSKKITKQFIENSENPHLNHKMQYFGAHFKWYDFKEELTHIWEDFGQYLREDLFLLTSNKTRPEYLLHIDYDLDEPTKPVVGSLTWPVLNCNEDTVTVWYDAYKDGKKFYKLGQQDVVITDESIELVEIDRMYFDTEKFNAVILKHNDWHTLYNNSDSISNRMLLQWRFKPDLTWEQIKEITKKLWHSEST